MRKVKRVGTFDKTAPQPKEYDPAILIEGMIDGLPLVNEYIVRTHALTHTERENAKKLLSELMELTGFSFAVCK